MASYKRRADNNNSYTKTDLTLKVDGQEFHVNKAQMGYLSPFFKKMRNFRERDQQTVELQFPVTYEGMLEFLLCLYPGYKKPVTVDNVRDLFPLADYFQNDNLKATCESVMMEHLDGALNNDDRYPMDVPVLVDYLVACDMYKVKASPCLDKAVMLACKQSKKTLDAEPSFKEVSSAVKEKIELQRSELMHGDSVISENEDVKMDAEKMYDSSVYS